MPAPSHPHGRRAVLPGRTPPAIIERLNATMNAVRNLPMVADRFRILGIENLGGTPEQLAAAVKEEAGRWGPVILRGGISIQ